MYVVTKVATIACPHILYNKLMILFLKKGIVYKLKPKVVPIHLLYS